MLNFLPHLDENPLNSSLHSLQSQKTLNMYVNSGFHLTCIYEQLYTSVEGKHLKCIYKTQYLIIIIIYYSIFLLLLIHSLL